MSVSVRCKRPNSAGVKSSLSPGRSGLSSPAQLITRDTKDLQDQLWTLRKNYTRCSEKNSSLRDALRLCRKCLQERDRQLDIANRMINKLSLHREALENTVSEDKNSIRKLEASVTKAYSNVPGSVRAQNREIAELSERVQTAEATSHAANAVVDKYEREVLMLRAALDIHAHEFQDGSGETVHASLVLALGQAREESGQLGAQLAEAKMNASQAECSAGKLRKEQAWLLEQKRAAEMRILQLQTSGVDMSSKLELLQKEHKRVLNDLSFERDRVKDFENKDSQSMCHTQRLEQTIGELKAALETASNAADTQCKSASAQMQMQLDSLTAEHRSVQKSLDSRIVSLQHHVDSTTHKLQHARLQLEEEKRARAQEVQGYRAGLDEQRKQTAAAETKARCDQSLLQGRENEMQVLHHQIDDLTGINHQLQLELQESVAAGEQLKQELFSSVQRMAVKDHEIEQVVNAAEKATATLQHEYGRAMKENANLKQDVQRLQVNTPSAIGKADAVETGRNPQQSMHHKAGKMVSATGTQNSGSTSMCEAPSGPVMEQQISGSDDLAEFGHQYQEMLHHQDSNLRALDERAQKGQFSANTALQSENEFRQPSEKLAAQHSAVAIPSPHTAGILSCGAGWGRNLTAADLEHEPCTASTRQRRYHQGSAAPKRSAATPLESGVSVHCVANDVLPYTPKHFQGSSGDYATHNSRSRRPAVGNPFDEGSPCMSNNVSQNVESTFVPTMGPALEDEAGSCAVPVCSPRCEQHEETCEGRQGPFPGFSQPGTASGQDNNSGMRPSGELSCWEKRLKSAQEKLQLMRLEREQWHAMASVTDSARKHQHSDAPARSHMTGCYVGSLSAPGDQRPGQASSSAYSMAGRHRHRKLQMHKDYDAQRQSAAGALGSSSLVPHEPQECTSHPGAEPGHHAYSAEVEKCTLGHKEQYRSFKGRFDTGRGEACTDFPFDERPPVRNVKDSNQPARAFVEASRGVLHTFRTPKLTAESEENATSLCKRDSGLTQQSHATWVADSIRQSVTGALDQAMEALEAELARKLPVNIQAQKKQQCGQGSVRTIVPAGVELQESGVRNKRMELEPRLDSIARMQVNEFGSGCGDL